jgi:hypothetical protein
MFDIEGSLLLRAVALQVVAIEFIIELIDIIALMLLAANIKQKKCTGNAARLGRNHD